MHSESANAKINLYLNILGRRENGYHDIESLMQSVSLCDRVDLDFVPGEETEISLTAVGNDEMPTDRRNLAWRAAALFCEASGRAGKITIAIEKRIPMAAGLAGGSADAAAVLRGLNRLCGSPFSTEKLCALGARLGADIPFCIVGGAALVSGIGERLAPTASLPGECRLVVACQGEGVSTPAAYAALDARHGNFEGEAPADPRLSQLTDAIAACDILRACDNFYNIFEEVVPPERPYIDRIKAVMQESGAIRTMMSGSGPSVFGIFPSDEAAATACRRLSDLGAAAAVCQPI